MCQVFLGMSASENHTHCLVILDHENMLKFQVQWSKRKIVSFLLIVVLPHAVHRIFLLFLFSRFDSVCGWCDHIVLSNRNMVSFLICLVIGKKTVSAEERKGPQMSLLPSKQQALRDPEKMPDSSLRITFLLLLF